MANETNNDSNSVALAQQLTVAWLSNPNTRATADDATSFLDAVHKAVAGLSAAPSERATLDEASTDYTPAVSVRKSLADPNVIISMIDGKPYKSLTRHLSSRGITPAEYRSRYGLKADYPLVAPAYSEARRAMAKKIGLGRKPGQRVTTKVAEQKPATKGRRSVTNAKKAAQAHLSGE